MKIVQINGFRGMLMAVFIVSCLFAGFVISPGVVAMKLWNHYLTGAFGFPLLNLFQGILLWGIVVLTYQALFHGYMPVSFASPDKISDAEFDMIMKKAKIHSDLRKMNTKIMSFDKFEKEFLNKKDTDNTENQESNDKISNLK